MQRTGILTLTDSVPNAVLTPPTDHKYEVLEIVVNTDGTDDAIIADYLKLGGSYILTAWTTHEVSGSAALRVLHNGLVVYEGEEYGIVPVGGGSTVYGLVTYIDVDFA